MEVVVFYHTSITEVCTSPIDMKLAFDRVIYRRFTDGKLFYEQVSA